MQKKKKKKKKISIFKDCCLFGLNMAKGFRLGCNEYRVNSLDGLNLIGKFKRPRQQLLIQSQPWKQQKISEISSQLTTETSERRQ